MCRSKIKSQQRLPISMSDISVEKSFERLGFTVLPSFLTDEEQVKILAYLDRSLSGSIDESNLSIAERSRARKAGKIVAVSEQKYGREYYIQTDNFQNAVFDSDGCYSRTPSDTAKHSIPKESARLEDERNAVIKALSERIQLLPQIANEKLYLIQCVQYNGKFERGKHIDNKVNGGDIIVGCSIGPTERYIELSGEPLNTLFTYIFYLSKHLYPSTQVT